jgi:perosamine synthetase
MVIQVFKPSIGDEEVAAVEEVLRSGWLGLGPKTAEFEHEFADYVGAPFAVAMNSGTAALHLALRALGIGKGDEVLVPTITFASTALAVVYCGARPVFVDVDPETLCIDVEDTARRVTNLTRAVMPVHYGGRPCDMEAVWSLAKANKLLVVEDAAHACGARYGQHKIGGSENSDATCFSFHAVKNLTCGEGGMVTTTSSFTSDQLRRLRWCGIDKSTWKRTEAVGTGARPSYGQYSWYYEIAELGYKSHMSDVAAAIGLAQLAKLDKLNTRRREIARLYDGAFEELDWLDVPPTHGDLDTSQHNYVVRMKRPGVRDRLNLYLKEKGIATGVHYVPIHMQPYFAAQGQPSLPVAEDVWQRVLTLPMYPDLTDEQVEYICECVRGFGE